MNENEKDIVERILVQLEPELAKEAIKIFAKYDEYKRLEEELGIDLITLFKALNDGFLYKFYYTGKDYHIRHCDKARIDFALDMNGKKLFCLKPYNAGNGDICYLIEYGTKWSLTKEELK